MRRGAYGHIVNMVGLSGHRIPDGPQGGGFYCGTKAAVKMMTEGLRQEVRDERGEGGVREGQSGAGEQGVCGGGKAQWQGVERRGRGEDAGGAGGEGQWGELEGRGRGRGRMRNRRGKLAQYGWRSYGRQHSDMGLAHA